MHLSPACPAHGRGFAGDHEVTGGERHLCCFWNKKQHKFQLILSMNKLLRKPASSNRIVAQRYTLYLRGLCERHLLC